MPLPSTTIDALARRYPRTIAAFAEMGALDHLERILRLDMTWDAIRPPTTNHRLPTAKDRSQQPGFDRQKAIYAQSKIQNPKPVVSNVELSKIDYDLIYAGGGLGLLHAAVMARRYGYRVLLFDRGEVGCAHREWNISRPELDALIATGFCTWDELRDVIMSEYDRGVVRFYAGASRQATELWMRDVLNVALEAGALLRLARRKLAEAGGLILDRRTLQRVVASDSGPVRVLVELARNDEWKGADSATSMDEGSIELYGGRLLLDGMGSSSPLALHRGQSHAPAMRARPPFAGVCPTVGTVAAGFIAGTSPDVHNPRVGDILISVANAQRGQQYMWEGFPGRDDQLTVYLFYYDTLRRLEIRDWRLGSAQSPISNLQSPISLMQLFEDYFTLLPTYKRLGPRFRHIKPVYGYIPARHSLWRQEAPLLRGILPIGDSAAQQSPLTFCGFGSHIRNLGRSTALLDQALCHDLLEPRHLRAISAYQINVSLNWVFSRFMQPWDAPDDVNRLQNVFLSVLNDLGEDLARRFFRDQMRWGDYHRMILGTFRRYPRIVTIAWRVLGPAGIRQWIGDYLAYSGAALLAWAGRRIGLPGQATLVYALGRLAPAAGLWLRARLAEWRAMGWS